MKVSNRMMGANPLPTGPINMDDAPDCLSFNMIDFHSLSCVLYVIFAVVIGLVNIDMPRVISSWHSVHWSNDQSTFNLDSRFTYDNVSGREYMFVLLWLAALPNAIVTMLSFWGKLRLALLDKRHVNYFFAVFDVILAGAFQYILASWCGLIAANSQMFAVGLAIARELTRVTNENSTYTACRSRASTQCNYRVWSDIVCLVTFWFIVFVNLTWTTKPHSPGFLITWAILISVIDLVRTAWSVWFVAGFLKNPHSYRSGDLLIILTKRLLIASAIFMMPYW